MRRIERVIHSLSLALVVIVGLLILAIMLGTTADVTRRKLKGEAVPGVIELSGIVLPAVAFFSIPFTQRKNGHVATTLVTGRLSQRGRSAVRLVGMCLAWVAFAGMCGATAVQASHSYSINEYQLGLLQIPIWPIKIAIPVGILALLLEMGLVIGKVAWSLKNPGNDASSGGETRV